MEQAPRQKIHLFDLLVRARALFRHTRVQSSGRIGPLVANSRGEIALAPAEIAESLIVHVAQITGGNIGSAIAMISFAIRLILLPLTLRAARSAIAKRALMQELQPKLNALQKRYKNDAKRLAEEMAALMKEHDVTFFDRTTLLLMGVQLPIFMSIFPALQSLAPRAGRFLWIQDLGKPDVVLTGLVAALVGAGVSLSPTTGEENRALAVWLPTVVTVFFLWRMSAAVGLYWAASSAVGVVQSAMLRRSR